MTEIIAQFDAVARAVRQLPERFAAIQGAKAAYAHAREDVCDQVMALCAGEPGPPEDPQLVALVRHLYWAEPEVPALRLAEAAGFTSLRAMLSAIGPAVSGVACVVCGSDIPRPSRSWYPRYAHSVGGRECGPCGRARGNSGADVWRLNGLRSCYAAEGVVCAPAWEWAVAVELVGAFPPLTAGIVPGSDDDDATGTWYEFDSSIFVRRLIEGRALGDRRPVAVAQEPASVLVQAARNVAAWDIAHAAQMCAELTSEPLAKVLDRLHQRIVDLRVQREHEAIARFPDGHRVTDQDFPPRSRWRATVRTKADDT